MKYLLILALAIVAQAGGAQPSSVEVFTNGVTAGMAGRFPDSKVKLTFVSLPAGAFKKPDIIKYAMFEVPHSIRRVRQEQAVDVGVVVSEKGKVLATCIVSSNSKPLEHAARTFASALGYRPASIDGKPVNFYFVLPVTYKYVDPETLLKGESR